MRAQCVYKQLRVQMYLKGIDINSLAEKTGIGYGSLCRKLRGAAPLTIEEAQSIQKTMDCGMTLDTLFEV